jgi:DNA-binding MarR family transcriptional regulator
MCAEGLVARVRDAADRRVTRIELTDGGRARQAELATVADDLDLRLRSLFTADEYDVLDRAISRITAYAEESDVITSR